MQLGKRVNFSFFLHGLHYNDICATLLNELKSVDENILKLFGNKLINLFLDGAPQFDSRLLNAAIKCIIDPDTFTESIVFLYLRTDLRIYPGFAHALIEHLWTIASDSSS